MSLECSTAHLYQPTFTDYFSQQQFTEHFFDQNPEAQLVVENGFIRDANQQFLLKFGYRKEEIVQCPIQKLFPDLSDWSDCPKNSEKVIHAVTKSGIFFDAAVKWNSFSWNEHRIVILSVRDFTEIKQAKKDEALRNKRLLSQVIVTPLNAISGGLQTLDADQFLIKKQELISKTWELERGLRRYLDFIDVTEGGVESKIDTINLKELLDSLLEKKRKEFKGEIHLQFAPIQEHILADEKQLMFILKRLIDNAITYTKHGDIWIEVKEDVQYPKRLVISVQDSGPGIDKQTLKDILEHKTLKPNVEGCRFSSGGMGLSICDGYVRMMGGKLTGESELGKGTKFSFTIPKQVEEGALSEMPLPSPSLLSQSPLNAPSQTTSSATTHASPSLDAEVLLPPQAVPAVPLAESSKPSALRVLIVDDSKPNRLVLKQLLKKAQDKQQFHVDHLDEAADGKEAVEKVKNGLFNIIFMDVWMPIKDGIEATQEIRLLSNCDKEKLFISGVTADPLEEKCLNAGMNAFIKKPIKEEKFYDFVDSVRSKIKSMSSEDSKD